ncbi:hypothetical protein SDRG_14254 [Saprolegnia diclina VS20]|uniref:E3 ubiquitin-protein ligase n=1 Tax=Saprolegnia diclina (strain VS20) TaxID=1156394 RepID=T0R7G0_SAPDV|nr:hypothetical protein SDRG_14254 [Saprolegnia diclina VS20]EQC27978.1 hypothetical protein SDRG_14254 [Saprolegnia diclina VS20]|eukprot:XP_008618591.1 hypothetical protein SDRG_14254 [Saprolegnia diclina VS20]
MAATTTTYTWLGALKAAIDGNPAAVTRKRMCGYEFRPGDMAWNCRQCQKDDTCVMCHKCFTASHAHLTHDVMFYYAQNGNGCCDCGDEEAWSPHGFCPDHNTTEIGNAPPPDILASVPSPLLAQARADVASDIKLFHAFAKTRRAGFRRKLPEDGPDTLYDLYVHVPDLNHQGSASLASTLPESVTLIQRNLSASEVLLWQSKLAKKQPANLCSIFHSHDMHANLNVVALCNRLSKCALSCDVGCRLVAEQMLLPESFLVDVIVADCLFPRHDNEALHSLIMALIPDPDFKQQFAIAFATSYPQLFQDFLLGLGLAGHGILGFGVQFLNRASFVHLLMHSFGFFGTLLRTLHETLASFAAPAMDAALPSDVLPLLQPPGRLWDSIATYLSLSSAPNLPDVAVLQSLVPYHRHAPTEAFVDWFRQAALPLPGRLGLTLDATGFTSHRYTQVLLDLKYTLQIAHPTLLSSFPNELRLLFHTLSLAQGLGADARLQASEPHVAYEGRHWIVAIELSSMLNELVSAVYANVVQHHVQPSVLEAVPLLVSAWHDAFCLWLATTNQYYAPTSREDGSYMLPRYGAADVRVSAHYPLHRSLCLLYRSLLSKKRLCHAFRDALLTTLGANEWHVHMLVLPLLEGLVWDAQVHAGLWKRNGWSVMNHSMNYGEPYYCMKFRNVDLLGLQLLADVVGIEAFVPLLLDRYDTAHLDCASTSVHEAMLAECVALFCQLATEVPVLDSSESRHPLYAALRHLVLLRLCVKPSSHSELFKCVNEFCATYDVLCASHPVAIDALLKDIAADICLPDQKVYTLKPEMYEEYNATSVHLTRKQHEVARVNRAQARATRFRASTPTAMAAAPAPLHVAHRSCLLTNMCFFLVLHPSLCQIITDVVQHLETIGSSSLVLAIVHLLTLQMYALQQSPRDVQDTYLRVIDRLGLLDTLRSLSSTNDELLRHVAWVVQALEAFPGLRPAPTPIALETGSSRSTVPDRHARQTSAQQRALEKIQQQQAAFSKLWMDDDAMGMEDDDDEECAMCHETSTPLSSIGFVQVSGVNVVVPPRFKTPWEDMKRDVTPLTIACCGHLVHLSCWQAYYATQFQKVITGEAYLNAVDVKKGEFLCPVCKSIANVLVPLQPPAASSPSVALPPTTDWAAWLNMALPAPSVHEPESDVAQGLGLMCMSIHRVATGSVEKSRPDRYLASACHAIASTLWHTRPAPAVLLQAAQSLRAVAPAAVAYDSARALLMAGSELDGVETTETQTPTQIQKTWKGVVGAKPLLLQDLSAVLARGVLLAPTQIDQVCMVQLVSVAYAVQTFLWLVDETTAVDADEEPATAFVSQWFRDGSHVASVVAQLCALPSNAPFSAAALAWAAEDITRFHRVATDLVPGVDAIPVLPLDALPPAVASLVPKWIAAVHATYTTMDDPNNVLTQWQHKHASYVADWASVWQQDLAVAHVPLSSAYWRHTRSSFLASLPHSYSELYMHLTKQTCPSCHLFPARPALCLMCGLVLCAASTCREATVASMASVSGACTLHAHKCGRGLGLFLLTVEGTVLLVSGKLAAYDSNGLYVDEYGEGFGERTSRFQFRGRPLFLDVSMRDRLLRLWETQSIHMEIVHNQNTVERIVINSFY